MKAVIYARYSSDLQREESAEAQIRFCREYAEIKDIDIVGIYVDKEVSGKGEKVKKRLEFQKMIRDSEKGLFDIVLVHKYNRFARNERDHVNYEGRLNDNNVILTSTKEDFGQGKGSIVMRAMMRALSQYYIEDMADEVRKGHRENALKAMHNGGYSPFGYDVIDQKFIINELEASYVRKMFTCALDQVGFSDLTKEMKSAGIKGKRGKLIKYPSIYEILRNERYTGTYVYAITSDKHDRRAKKNAVRIENAMPAIVTRQEWEEVQMIMNKRKQTGRNSDYLCRGLVYCLDCGAKMNGHISKKGDTEYRSYVCSKSCGVGTIKMDGVDDTVREYIKELLSDKMQKEISKTLQTYSKGEADRIEFFNNATKQEMKDKQKQYGGLMETLTTGGLPAEVIVSVGYKMKILQDEIVGLSEIQPPKDYTEKNIIDWLNNIKQSPSSETVHILVEKITANKKEINVFSTLTSFLSNIGGDTPIHCFPTILFEYHA